MPRLVNKKSIKSKKKVKGGSRTSQGLTPANSNNLSRRLARARANPKYLGIPPFSASKVSTTSRGLTTANSNNLARKLKRFRMPPKPHSSVVKVPKATVSSPKKMNKKLDILSQYKLYTKQYLDVREKLNTSLLKYKIGNAYDLVKVKQHLKPMFFSKNIEMIEEFQILLRKKELLTSLLANLKSYKSIVNTKSKKKVNTKEFHSYMLDKLLGVSKNVELLKKNLIKIKDSKDGGTGSQNELSPLPSPPTNEPMPDINHLSQPVNSNNIKFKRGQKTAIKM